jgi:hypothetical protein
MSANLKIYSNAECTTELVWNVNKYEIRFGPETGLNGTSGETLVSSVWVKNTGDILISNVSLSETSDTDTRGSYSLNGTDYNATTLTLGNMAVNDVVRVYVKIVVASGTQVHVDEPLNFTVSGTYLS